MGAFSEEKSVEPSFLVWPSVGTSEAAWEHPQAGAYLLLVVLVPVGGIEAKKGGSVRQTIALVQTEAMFE